MNKTREQLLREKAELEAEYERLPRKSSFSGWDITDRWQIVKEELEKLENN